MGTLQSFTPLPDCAFTLFLLNPSRLLANLFNHQTFKQQCKFETQTVNEFPLTSLLEARNPSQKKILKVIVEEQNLIDVSHFALLFHHQILIVKKSLSLNNSLAKLHKEIKFKDEIESVTKIYSPIEIECLRHCASIQLKDLKNFIENSDDFTEEQQSQNLRIDSKMSPSVSKNTPLDLSVLGANDLNKKKQLQQIKIRNYKRRSTLQSHTLNMDLSSQLQPKNSQPLTVGQNVPSDTSSYKSHIPYLLFGHHPCPFNPISLIFNQLPQRMTKKILSLLKFYKATFIRYPSLETFIAAGCNSTKIVCGPAELDELAKKIEADEYPFTFSSLNGLSMPSLNTLNPLQNDSSCMQINQHTHCATVSSDSQDITLYCFCNEGFQNTFTTNNTKLIGVLKDKLIEIKFFKNLIELVKQLFKDQHLQNSGDMLKQILRDKMCMLSNKKLRSNIDNGSWLHGDEPSDKVLENSVNNDPILVSYKELPPNQVLRSRRIKIDSLTHIPHNSPFLIKLSQKSIQKMSKTSSNHNINSSTTNISEPKAILKQDRTLSQINSTVYFVMHQKQNDQCAIKSLPKKISRGLKNMKVKKVIDLNVLVEKLRHQYISIVVLKDNAKILQEFYTIVELKAVEDKVILIKRQQSDTHQTLIKKIVQSREVGLVKVHKFNSFSFLSRKLIVMGSKPYLKHIFKAYPFLDVKEFIDITIYKEHRKIREIISRKNQTIVSNVVICEICNIEYRGVIKARIVYYEHQDQNRNMITVGRGDCKCSDNRNPGNGLKLDQLLECISCQIPVYPYTNKKLQNSASQISVLFSKIKQKKALPIFQTFPHQTSQILFLCADSWIIQQITMIIIKLFTTRYSSIWLCPWMTKKIVYDTVKECENVLKFLVDSAMTIYKGQVTTKASQIIQQAKLAYKYLKDCLDEVGDIYQLAKELLRLFVDNALFRKAVNYAWRNLLSLNKHEYPVDCCTLLLVLFLGFRNSSSLKRNDSINDGTFKSFRNFHSNSNLCRTPSRPHPQTHKLNQSKTLSQPIQFKCSIQKDHSFQRASTRSKHQTEPHDPIFKQTLDQIVEQPDPKPDTPASSKIYLRLMNYEKADDDRSLRKFFISKNNASSYMYTTEFLVFQIINQKEINAIVEKFSLKDSKLANIAKNNTFGHGFALQKHKKERGFFQSTQKHNKQQESRESAHLSLGKSATSKMSFLQQSQPLVVPMFFSLLSTRSPSKIYPNSLPKSKQSGILQLKQQKKIQILPSTEQSLIICIENIQLLNYNIFMPFYRSQSSKNNQRKTFIIPPFTKLEINNNYSNINTIAHPETSLVTHQLKLSPEHQQRFLEKVLETFLVEKSQFNQNVKEEKIQYVSEDKSGTDGSNEQFKLDKSGLSQENIPIQVVKKRDGQIFIANPNVKSPRRSNSNPWQQIKLIDQKFELPCTDQFFILMNKFKYFSAHNLLLTQLPTTNMTNAYHAILLTRKGLYHQASQILSPSNPFEFTVQQYINELKNRILANNSIPQSNDHIHSHEHVKKNTPKVLQWTVTYSAVQEKFFVNQKNDPKNSYCYNDDSLDVIYKKVFTKLHHKTDLSNSENTKPHENPSLPEQDFLASHPRIATGTFVNIRKPTRRHNKQASIVYPTKDRYSTLFNSRQRDLAVEIGNDTSTISSRSQIHKMSMKSRDSILNDMRFFQQIEQKNPILSGLLSQGQRISRFCSSSSSSFMFGSSSYQMKPGIPLKKNIKRTSRLSYQKQSVYKNPMIEMNVQQEIQERSSSSSDIQSQILKDKKATPIHVRTRNKSNFFIEKAQQLKNSASCINRKISNKQKNSRDNIFIDQEFENFQKSTDREKNSLSNPKFNHYDENQSIAQKIMNSDYQQLEKNVQPVPLVSSSMKGPILLFKHFQNENKAQNDDRTEQNDKNIQVPNHQNKKKPKELKSKSTQQIKNGTQNISPQNIQINTIKGHKGDKNSDQTDENFIAKESISKNNDPKDTQKSIQTHKSMSPCNIKGVVFKKGPLNSSNPLKASELQPRQTSKDKNKLKCRFTLEISSQSSDEQKIFQHVTKEQAEVQIFQNHPSSQSGAKIETTLKARTKEFSLSPITHNKPSPYKKLSDYLQMNRSDSSFDKSRENLNQDGQSDIASQTQGIRSDRINEKKLSFQNVDEKDQFQITTTHLKFNFQKKPVQTSDNQEFSLHGTSPLKQSLKNQKNESSVASNQSQQIKVPDLTQLNQISEVSSQMKSSSSDENISKDHEEYLKSHTNLFIWHNKIQIQKQLRSNTNLNPNANLDQNLITSLNSDQNQQILDKNNGIQDKKQPSQKKTKLKLKEAQLNQKKRTDKSSFTFMKHCIPPTPEVNFSHMQDHNSDEQIDDQSQHIIHFHSQLMNNSSMCKKDLVPAPQSNNYLTKKNLSTIPKPKPIQPKYEEIQNFNGRYHIGDGSNYQKFTINVKAVKNDRFGQFNNPDDFDKVMKKSVLELNHQREMFEVQKRQNLSYGIALQKKISLQPSQKHYDESFYESESHEESKDEDKLLEAMLKSASQQRYFTHLKPQMNNKKQQDSGTNRKRKSSSQLESDQHGQRQKNKKYKCQYKIHPQELVYLSPKQSFQLKKEKIKRNSALCQDKEDESAQHRRLNVASLRNLKLNCDIRRKR